MPPEIIRLIMSFARPLRPYIHELKYYFVYKNCTMFDEEERPQPYFETGDSEDYSSDEDFSHEEVILPKIKPVYAKGFLGEIKNWKKEMEYMEWYNSFGITDEDEQRMRDEIFEDVYGTGDW